MLGTKRQNKCFENIKCVNMYDPGFSLQVVTVSKVFQTYPYSALISSSLILRLRKQCSHSWMFKYAVLLKCRGSVQT